MSHWFSLLFLLWTLCFAYNITVNVHIFHAPNFTLYLYRVLAGPNLPGTLVHLLISLLRFIVPHMWLIKRLPRTYWPTGTGHLIPIAISTLIVARVLVTYSLRAHPKTRHVSFWIHRVYFRKVLLRPLTWLHSSRLRRKTRSNHEGIFALSATMYVLLFLNQFKHE